MTWTVDDYIREEVWRQGHDLQNPLDGGIRIAWMTQAWRYAELNSAVRDKPTFEDIVHIGKLVEQKKNAGGLRKVGVRVGGRVCPPPEEVEDLLRELLETKNDLEPLDFYRELLLIHPFVDGNGRASKVVKAWREGSGLKSPIFPPNDFWGHWIQNP